MNIQNKQDDGQDAKQQNGIDWLSEIDKLCKEICGCDCNDNFLYNGELSEEDYYPAEDNRVYEDGITGNGYDSLYEYRKDFFEYIKDFE